eukprot:gene8472-9964_t
MFQFISNDVGGNKAEEDIKEQHKFWEPLDEPVDTIALGQSGWTLLHTMAAYYPEKPTAARQQHTLNFLESFSHVYPCNVCAKDLQEVLVAHPPKSIGLAYFLWFFLGIFGVHRFYLQRNVSAFIYLFTLGLFGIGWLVDLFLLPSMVRHFNNHYFSDPTVIVAPTPIIYQNQPYLPQPYPYQPAQYQPYAQPPPMVQPYAPQPNNSYGSAPYNPPAY